MQQKTEGYVEEWILEVLAQREKYIILYWAKLFNRFFYQILG